MKDGELVFRDDDGSRGQRAMPGLCSQEQELPCHGGEEGERVSEGGKALELAFFVRAPCLQRLEVLLDENLSRKHFWTDSKLFGGEPRSRVSNALRMIVLLISS